QPAREKRGPAAPPRGPLAWQRRPTDTARRQQDLRADPAQLIGTDSNENRAPRGAVFFRPWLLESAGPRGGRHGRTPISPVRYAQPARGPEARSAYRCTRGS